MSKTIRLPWPEPLGRATDGPATGPLDVPVVVSVRALGGSAAADLLEAGVLVGADVGGLAW